MDANNINDANGEQKHTNPSPIGGGAVAAKPLRGEAAFLFDYGGTLDTGGCHWGQMLWHAYQRQNVPISEGLFRDGYVYGERTLGNVPMIKPEYSFHRTLDIKIRLEMEYICSHGWNADEEELKQKHDAVLEDVYARTVEVTQHSRMVLERLHKQYPMAVVTNFYGNIRTVLREFHLDSFFQDVIESSEVHIRKPDPRIWTIGVERLGLKPEQVTVVGDSYYKDIQPALKAGCHAIWLKGEGWTKRKYDESVPDRVITDLDQL